MRNVLWGCVMSGGKVWVWLSYEEGKEKVAVLLGFFVQIFI